MSKAIARNTESYANEDRSFEEAVSAVKSSGFRSVTARKSGPVKIIDAASTDGGQVSFWVKLGWSNVAYAATQFGLFDGPEGSKKSDKEFVQFVAELVQRFKKNGVTHALLFHRGVIVAILKIDDVAVAYREQMKRFPSNARNTKSPTMWFFDPRANKNAKLIEIVMRRSISLNALASRAQASATETESRSRIAEVEVRVAQAVFRRRVGERCGWRCAVTGSKIRGLLDAAYLPGKDWRKYNDADDGILLRTDIHRLVDAGLASIDKGMFTISKAAHLKQARAEYAKYEGRILV